MSILEKIRSRTGLLVGLVGLALAIFILESLLGSGQTLFGGRDTSVGSIAGDNIDYTQYQNKVNEQINMVLANNPNASIEEMRGQITEIVWNTFINDKVVKPEYEKVGVSVSEDEMYDLMLIHPHQMVLQQLTNKETGRVHEVVATPDGNLDLIKLHQWVNGMNAEAERFWMNLETGIAESRRAEKYAALIKKGMYVTTAEAKEAYAQQNHSMNTQYVMKRYAALSDSAVKINDSDIQKYYNDHQYEFQAYETTRKIEYVSFDVSPSEQDMADLEKDANRIAAEFKTKTIAEDSNYVAQESEGGQVNISDMTRQTMIIRDSSVYTDPVGTVYGPYNEGAYFKVYKLEGINTVADSGKVRHLLVAYKGAERSQATRTKEQAKKLTDSLLTLIKGGTSFDAMVDMYSDDGGKNKPTVNFADPRIKEQLSQILFDVNDTTFWRGKGGNYGWIKANQQGMAEAFVKGATEHKKGDLVIKESQFGYHIMEVLDISKTNFKTYRVAQIFKLIAPSPETTNKYFAAASDFMGQNNTAELFDKAVEKQKLNKRLAENIKESDKALPGLDNAKELVRWVYSAKKGEVSPQVFSFKDKFVVAKLTGIRNKGTLPLEEVREEVIVKARQSKKADEFIKEFNTKAAGARSIDDYASKLGLKVEEAAKINFASFNAGTLGREDALIGTAAGLKQGQISKPLSGETGVFVVVVTGYEDGTTPFDAKVMRQQTEQMLSGRADYEVYNALREKANIEDHRAKFE
jgi:peptidyl-prolyl cis-trans isomerase D